MAKSLPESPTWVDKIYQVELDTPVLGGDNGPDNWQAQQLASRTSYLKEQVESVQDLALSQGVGAYDDLAAAQNAINAGIEQRRFFQVWSDDKRLLTKKCENVGGIATFTGDGLVNATYTFSESTRLTQSRNSLSSAANASFNVSLAESVSTSQNFTSPSRMAVFINDIHGATSPQGNLISDLAVISNGTLIFSLKVLTGDHLNDGVRTSKFRGLPFDNLNHVSTSIDTSVIRVIYSTYFNDLDYTNGSYLHIFDETNVFAPTTYLSAPTVTVPSSAVHGETGNVILAIPKATLIAAGYPVTEEGVLSYLSITAANCAFRIRVTTTVVEYFDGLIIADPGTLNTVITNKMSFQGDYASAAVFDLSVRTSEQARLTANTSYLRFGCDVSNKLSTDIVNYPVELKVTFPQGVAKNSQFITVEDDSGNVLQCQFTDEWDVNSRHQATIGRWSDGSLRSGSLFVIDSIPAGQTRYYTVKVYQHPQRAFTAPELIKDSVGYTLNVGGIHYNFKQNNSFQLSSITQAGVEKAFMYGTYVSTVNALGSIEEGTFAPNRCGLSIISHGPVFTEVETILYNRPRNNIGQDALKARIRTKIFTNGMVKIDAFISAVTDIASGVVFGAMSRTNIDVESSIINSSLANAIWLNSTTGRKESVSVVYANGDIHRDGEAWGPTRPAYSAVIPLSDIQIRSYAGWRFDTAAVVAAAVPAGWTWTHGLWVNLDESTTDPAVLAAHVHNRPVGVLGMGVHQYVQQQRVADQIAELLVGYTRFWRNDATPLEIGSPPRNGYAGELVAFVKYGIGDFDAIYNDFINYCATNHGGITSLGAKYTAGSLLLQFASRTIAQPLWWLYKLAEQRGDAAKVATLKTGILNLATALKNKFASQGGIPLQGSQAGIGNSNSNATGYRFIAMAVGSGQDGDGSFAGTLTALDALFKTKFMVVENIIMDGTGEQLPRTHYLHYQAYAYNNYLLGCRAAGRAPAFDMGNYFIAAMAAYGAPKDVEYCISESRRGSVDTVSFMLYNNLRMNGLSGIHAAQALVEQIETEFGPRPGYPRAFYGFDPHTQDPTTLMVGFMLNILADVWFDYNFYEV